MCVCDLQHIQKLNLKLAFSKLFLDLFRSSVVKQVQILVPDRERKDFEVQAAREC